LDFHLGYFDEVEGLAEPAPSQALRRQSVTYVVRTDQTDVVPAEGFEPPTP
jgi:hypothetical protein